MKLVDVENLKIFFSLAIFRASLIGSDYYQPEPGSGPGE